MVVTTILTTQQQMGAMDIHENRIIQSSKLNQRVDRNNQIGCNVSSASYDGRSRGIYDSIPTGRAYIYSHL